MAILNFDLSYVDLNLADALLCTSSAPDGPTGMTDGIGISQGRYVGDRTVTPTATGWFSCGITPLGHTADRGVWEFKTAGGTLICAIAGADTGSTVNSRITIRRSISGTMTTVATTAAAEFVYNSGTRFDVKIDIAGGVIEVWKNRVLILSWSGDLSDGGTFSTVGRYRYGSTHDSASSPTIYYCPFFADENSTLIFTDQIDTLANGAHQEWVGNEADIDDDAVSFADFIVSNAANQRSTYTITARNVTYSTGHDVIGVAVAAMGRHATGGNLAPMLRSGTTDVVGPTVTLGITDAGGHMYETVDPNTAGAWTYTSIGSMQIGVKSLP